MSPDSNRDGYLAPCAPNEINDVCDAAKRGYPRAIDLLGEIKSYCADRVKLAEQDYPGIYRDALHQLDQRKRQRALTALVDLLDIYGDALLDLIAINGEAS